MRADKFTFVLIAQLPDDFNQSKYESQSRALFIQMYSKNKLNASSMALRQTHGEGTEHDRAFCESAEQANSKSGADETKRMHSKHRRDDDEAKQPSTTPTSEKRRKGF